MFERKSSGKVIYDPWRGDMKRRTNGWCVLDVDREITRYYREWLRVERHIRLQPPSWDAHISIVRGERLHPSKVHLWKKYHDKTIEFTYGHPGDYYDVRSRLQDRRDESGQFFIVNIESPQLMDIRQELGLPTNWHLHLTFGRIYEYEARKPKR